uniref:Unconventional myosin-XVIIIb n=1 Tax=Fundulus heteroclitus TaxID=8078 RepID=A0A3Q2U147_FUNHE
MCFGDIQSEELPPCETVAVQAVQAEQLISFLLRRQTKLCLWIKEENKPVAATIPPPPLSVLPGGILKQLVRDSEKETKHKDHVLVFFSVPFLFSVGDSTSLLFFSATQLKPDDGTPELPDGRMRVRLETDGSLHDVPEFEVEKCNPSELDLCEDLSDLQTVNESGVLHTLTSRAKANMPLTHAGPNLVSLWPPLQTHSKVRGTTACAHWDEAAQARPQHAKLSHMLSSNKPVQLDRTSAVGTHPLRHEKRTRQHSPECFTQAFVSPVERVQAMFTILRSFGCVSSQHSDASSRFAMVFSLDFNHAGQVSAGQLQTMMLDKWKVCQKSPGESNFLVFSQMLAGLSTDLRTELQLHQLPESNSFGILQPTKVEEKQRASVAFTKLLTAMETLSFSAGEQKAIWHVLAAIYHLGAAGACKVGRRQFVNFDSAQAASSILGCEAEELDTAVFKHHLRQLLQKATGPRLIASQCVDGMAAGLYEELFTVIVSLINRALSSEQLALASVMVVDTPGLRNPRHCAEERGASWSELCHNYLQERLLEHYHTQTFIHSLDRYAQVTTRLSSTVYLILHLWLCSQVRAADENPRGLLWVLDEEMVTPASCESAALERVCRYYSNTGKYEAYRDIQIAREDPLRQCEQPLQCEVNHLTGCDPVRYDLTGWFGWIQNNQSSLNAISLGSREELTTTLFRPRISVPPLCRGLGGLEGGSQRALQRNGTIRKTFSGGMAAIRRYSHCIAVKLQADALVNLIRRARPVFLQCVSAKANAGSFDIPALRVQLHSTQILSALQLYRTGYPEHMTLSDFRCHFQALSPPIMKRYASMFVSHDERKAVEELLVELDIEKKSIVVGGSRVFMKRGVLQYLEQQRDQQVTGWLVYLQAACKGHLGRQKYRKLKVQQMAVRCLQRNLRVLKVVAKWSWWKLFCRVRPLLDVNMDNERLRAKEVHPYNFLIMKTYPPTPPPQTKSLLHQNSSSSQCSHHSVTSELSDERFRGDAVGQALDVERAERLRLTRENKDLLCKVTMETLEKQLEEEKQKAQAAVSQRGASELAMQLECSQTEVEFVRRRLKQTEEKLETERQTRQQLDTKVAMLQAQLEQSRRSTLELKRHCRRVTSDLQDARVLSDALQSRMHELERKQRRSTFHSVFCFITMLSSCHSVCHLWWFNEQIICLEESEARRLEAENMQKTLSMELENTQLELENMCRQNNVVSSVSVCGFVQLKQLEMQLEQEYEEKQIVIHEKHDLEGLIATLCEQVSPRPRKAMPDLWFRLDPMRHIKMAASPHTPAPTASPAASETQQSELSCRLVEEQLVLLQHENMDLLKRLEEDQEDLNELMKKHKALIAQSSSDISQIRDLQAELEEVKKQRHSLQEELQQCVSRVQFLESSTVGRSIVSKQEARVCDLENKLEFQKGQVKRFEVLVLRLRDSVVRLGEELEQSAQTEARERENARYFQQRLLEMKLEMEELSQREQDSSRRRMELEMQVEELSAVRQTLQADLETSIRRIVDLQAALEEVESSDDSETERTLIKMLLVFAVTLADIFLFICSSCLDPDDEGSQAGGVGTRHLSRAPSSSALSELLDGLRKRRAEPVDGAGSAVSLPIYQTTGASTLRRRGTRSVNSSEASAAEAKLSRFNSSGSASSLPSLPRLSSLSSSLSAHHHAPTLSIPEEDQDEPPRSATAFVQRSPQPLRRCLLESAITADGGEGSLGSEPMVFQNRRLTDGYDDAASDVLPAIRRAQSTSSLASSIRGSRRALSVHFGELPPSTRSRKGSETESSSSGGSGASSQGSGPRRRFERPQGERLEAEGSEGGDVASVMKKYLKKEID